MRRMTCLVMALAVVLGLAQCKKEQLNQDTESHLVPITLTVDGGTRAIVNPDYTNPETGETYASVAFETGDIIYVGYNNVYVGTLTYSGSAFSGSVNIESYDGVQPLHFYFLGGVGFTPAIDGNTATVVISDQTQKLPVVSYAPSKQAFTGEGAYSAKLQNKVSIMKFNVTTPSTAAICITGMNNKVTVDFTAPSGTDNGFTYGMDGEGVIKMHGVTTENTETWAIVLPQATVAPGNAYTEDNAYIGTRPSIPNGIVSNQYLSTDFNMTVNTVVNNSTPFTIEALTDGTIKVTRVPRNGMKYSLNGGTLNTLNRNETRDIEVSAGDKVQFYGNNTAYNTTKIAGGTASVKMYGNIMSLVDETNFATVTTLPADQTFNSLFLDYANLTDASYLLLPAMTLKKYCYGSMFSRCSNLTAAPALPAETLTESCYSNMFYGCTNLTTAPELHATTLAPSCYDNMFNGCTSLTAAPELSATVPTSASSCYNFMFKGCTSLTTAPELPSMTLASTCYSGMFKDCTSLTTAPVLCATTLAQACYSGMFSGCSNLNSVTCLATDISASNCTYNWLTGVASTGTFTKTAGVTWSTGTSGIPEGWTIEAMAPTGSISGKFTVNSDGDQVYFSQGNLQYIGSAATPYWKFADNQWSYLGNSGQGSAVQNVDRDLFGWGTGDAPNKVSTSASDYNTWNEWGNNAISNGGNTANNGWRTLTESEWAYVFNTRTTTSGIRYAKAKVNNVSGVILLPDNWSGTYTLNNTNTPGANYTSNTISESDWTSSFEANGAVFLPTAGFRNGTSVGDVPNAQGYYYGHYWSSSLYNTGNAYRGLTFSYNGLQTLTTFSCAFGFSVRLVKDVN